LFIVLVRPDFYSVGALASHQLNPALPRPPPGAGGFAMWAIARGVDAYA